MIIKEFTIAQLDGQLQDLTSYRELIPITSLRLCSQVQNPRVTETDVVLIVAFDESGTILAYAGALPSVVFSGTEQQRAMFNTCWWAHPAKGATIAFPLLIKLFSFYQHKVVFNDLSEHTVTLLGKMPAYQLLPPLQGQSWYLRMNTAKFLSGSNKLKKISCKILDGFFNSVIKVAVNVFSDKFKDAIVQQITDWDEPELNQFIDRYNLNDVTRIGCTELKWITRYKWLTNDKAFQSEADRYPFSLLAESFNNHPLKIYIQGQLVGVALLTERNNHAKIPYFWYHPSYLDEVSRVLVDYVYQQRFFALSVYRPELKNAFLSLIKVRLFKRTITKYRGYTKNLESFHLSDKIWQDGDGDSVFT